MILMHSYFLLIFFKQRWIAAKKLNVIFLMALPLRRGGGKGRAIKEKITIFKTFFSDGQSSEGY